MGEPHYKPSGYPRRNKPGSSEFMRAEFRLIEAGIDAMDRYVFNFEHYDAYNTDRKYLVMPWDCIVNRVGFVTHAAITQNSLQLKVSNVDGSSVIELRYSDASNNERINILNGSAAGYVRSGPTIGNNTFSAGDVVRAECTHTSLSTADQRATSWIEITRTD